MNTDKPCEVCKFKKLIQMLHELDEDVRVRSGARTFGTPCLSFHHGMMKTEVLPDKSGRTPERIEYSF